MNNLEMKNHLRNKLLQIQSAKQNGPKQILLRCPVCLDSQKDLSHGHFSVKIDMFNDEPVIFHCFRCDISGILTPTMLRSFKINDLQLNSGLLSYNKASLGTNNKSFTLYNNNLNLRVPTPSDNERTSLKQKYIEGRLGVKFTIEELVNLKVVFNLGEFLKFNGIDTLTTNKYKARLLHNDYVGFLTARNEFINFRDITGRNERYDKYNVYNNLDNTRKFYTIPNSIDLLTRDKITINIAEGVFDILGIYHHLYEKEHKNIIYTSVNGCGFVSVIKYFIQMGIFGNVDVNIYSDKDKSPIFYKKLYYELKDWIHTINLFYNEIGKDYGVTKDKIKIIKRKIER